jgi:D-sedoheptulose 7-phosphate isomerase
MKELIENYIRNLGSVLERLNISEIEAVASVLKSARDKGNAVYIFGNGGSGSTASHFACDINKGTSSAANSRFKVTCLNDNIPIMLAYSNDIGYDVVFVEQLKNHLKSDDVVIGISGSGNSKNVLSAIEYANSRQAITIGITGFNGGELRQKVKYSFNANVNDMQISEDVHMIWVHIMMKCFLGS